MAGIMKISDLVEKLNSVRDITGDLPVFADGEGEKDWPYFDLPMHIDFENKRLVLGRWAKPEDDES